MWKLCKFSKTWNKHRNVYSIKNSCSIRAIINFSHIHQVWTQCTYISQGNLVLVWDYWHTSHCFDNPLKLVLPISLLPVWLYNLHLLKASLCSERQWKKKKVQGSVLFFHVTESEVWPTAMETSFCVRVCSSSLVGSTCISEELTGGLPRLYRLCAVDAGPAMSPGPPVAAVLLSSVPCAALRLHEVWRVWFAVLLGLMAVENKQ